MSRHSGPRLSGRQLAALVDIKPSTLEAYQSRHQAGVPVPCGREPVSGQAYWCQRHAHEWASTRPNYKGDAGCGRQQTVPL